MAEIIDFIKNSKSRKVQKKKTSKKVQKKKTSKVVKFKQKPKATVNYFLTLTPKERQTYMESLSDEELAIVVNESWIESIRASREVVKVMKKLCKKLQEK